MAIENIMVIIRNIWNHRNKVIFEKVSPNLDSILNSSYKFLDSSFVIKIFSLTNVNIHSLG